MRNFLYITIIAISVSFVYSQITFAACVGGPTVFTCNTDPPNPDPDGVQQAGNNADLTVNVLPGAAIDTFLGGMDDEAIELGDGSNVITIDQATVSGEDDGVTAGDGGNLINVTDSTITCDQDCISTRDGQDNINITRSRVESIDDDGIDTGRGDDVLIVIDSQILAGPACCNNFGITMNDGDDQITIINSRVAGFTMIDPIPSAIIMGDDNDTVTLGTGAQIDGLIRCGDGFDTIVFAMDVFEGAVALISSQIASKNPAGDSITINGLFYIWEDCELLVSELVGVRDLRPIPTLSEWGLITTAALLGLIGFMVIRRRKATA